MKQILIVDDSAVMRKVTRRILDGMRFQTSEAEDGRHALAAGAGSQWVGSQRTRCQGTRAAALAAERARRGFRGGKGAAMWRSCPSLQDALGQEAAGGGGDGGGEPNPAAPLRFCADLLPLPTA